MRPALITPSARTNSTARSHPYNTRRSSVTRLIQANRLRANDTPVTPPSPLHSLVPHALAPSSRSNTVTSVTARALTHSRSHVHRRRQSKQNRLVSMKVYMRRYRKKQKRKLESLSHAERARIIAKNRSRVRDRVRRFRYKQKLLEQGYSSDQIDSKLRERETEMMKRDREREKKVSAQRERDLSRAREINNRENLERCRKVSDQLMNVVKRRGRGRARGRARGRGRGHKQLMSVDHVDSKSPLSSTFSSSRSTSTAIAVATATANNSAKVRALLLLVLFFRFGDFIF